MGVYMDDIGNYDRHKPLVSFRMKCHSEWTVSDQNLPTGVFARSIFNLIGCLICVHVNTATDSVTTSH